MGSCSAFPLLDVLPVETLFRPPLATSQGLGIRVRLELFPTRFHEICFSRAFASLLCRFRFCVDFVVILDRLIRGFHRLLFLRRTLFKIVMRNGLISHILHLLVYNHECCMNVGIE